MRSTLSVSVRFIGVIVLLAWVLPLSAFAQDNRLINTHSWEYEYIQRLQQRGHLLELNPTDLPYAAGDVRRALEQVDELQLQGQVRRWHGLLARSLPDRGPNVDSLRVGGFFEGGVRHSSSERLSVIDPLGDGLPALPRGRVGGYLEYERWVGQMGATFDLFYDRDPDGVDVGRRLFMRGEESYFGYSGEMLDLHVGRFDNHWSEYGRRGGFLTDNPRSFDQLQLKFGTSRLSFSSILGELDNMGEDGSFTGRDYELGAFRRYLFLHRLDWSPVPQLKLSFIEGELYFSQTAGLSLRNLLPLQFLFFESHNAPMNNNSNLLIGGSIWYQTGPVTLFTQAMIDDFVVERRGELREENRLIPTTYTINSSVTVADVVGRFDLGLEADLVSANSYRSFRYQDQWTYAQRGLATNFSDYIRGKAYATFYPEWLEGLQVEPAVTMYWKGVGDMRELRTSTNPDGSQIPGILSGTVEQTLRPSLYVRYQPMLSLFGGDPSTTRLRRSAQDDNKMMSSRPAGGDGIRFNMWLDADLGYNVVGNFNNVEGEKRTRFIGLLRVFFNVEF